MAQSHSVSPRRMTDAFGDVAVLRSEVLRMHQEKADSERRRQEADLRCAAVQRRTEAELDAARRERQTLQAESQALRIALEAASGQLREHGAAAAAAASVQRADHASILREELTAARAQAAVAFEQRDRELRVAQGALEHARQELLTAQSAREAQEAIHQKEMAALRYELDRVLRRGEEAAEEHRRVAAELRQELRESKNAAEQAAALRAIAEGAASERQGDAAELRKALEHSVAAADAWREDAAAARRAQQAAEAASLAREEACEARADSECTRVGQRCDALEQRLAEAEAERTSEAAAARQAAAQVLEAEQRCARVEHASAEDHGAALRRLSESEQASARLLAERDAALAELRDKVAGLERDLRKQEAAAVAEQDAAAARAREEHAKANTQRVANELRKSLRAEQQKRERTVAALEQRLGLQAQSEADTLERSRRDQEASARRIQEAEARCREAEGRIGTLQQQHQDALKDLRKVQERKARRDEARIAKEDRRPPPLGTPTTSFEVSLEVGSDSTEDPEAERAARRRTLPQRWRQGRQRSVSFGGESRLAGSDAGTRTPPRSPGRSPRLLAPMSPGAASAVSGFSEGALSMMCAAAEERVKELEGAISQANEQQKEAAEALNAEAAAARRARVEAERVSQDLRRRADDMQSAIESTTASLGRQASRQAESLAGTMRLVIGEIRDEAQKREADLQQREEAAQKELSRVQQPCSIVSVTDLEDAVGAVRRVIEAAKPVARRAAAAEAEREALAEAQIAVRRRPVAESERLNRVCRELEEAARRGLLMAAAAGAAAALNSRLYAQLSQARSDHQGRCSVLQDSLQAAVTDAEQQRRRADHAEGGASESVSRVAWLQAQGEVDRIAALRASAERQRLHGALSHAQRQAHWAATAAAAERSRTS
eukprot:TRINITY_DN16050_c0_g1_i4.p1 TRINITY_DN16050_c0_g1~~TRINITY_DN16050_c0_g1_i4.p1  ORF type:complete len:901 (+),score=316.33 TRINITY_DN16050_c0_g1_i4:50-2752(+)